MIREKKNGGRGETRTPDPLLAKQVLCQLSYTPIEIGSLGRPQLLHITKSYLLPQLSPTAPSESTRALTAPQLPF